MEREARLLHVDGPLHAQKGEPEAARERLEAARTIFQRLGALKDVERTEQALTALPGTPRGRVALPRCNRWPRCPRDAG